MLGKQQSRRREAAYFPAQFSVDPVTSILPHLPRMEAARGSRRNELWIGLAWAFEPQLCHLLAGRSWTKGLNISEPRFPHL